MFQIEYSPQFEKMYRKLPKDVKLKAEIKERLLRKNSHDPRLKTHKLTGQLHLYWAFSIDYHYRIIFSFVSENLIRFHAIGTHRIYERFQTGFC